MLFWARSTVAAHRSTNTTSTDQIEANSAHTMIAPWTLERSSRSGASHSGRPKDIRGRLTKFSRSGPFH
jgi:hypothetical protein